VPAAGIHLEKEMSDEQTVNGESECAFDFLWGSEQIGRAIGRTERQTFHMLNGGHIKSAKKVGGRWVVSKVALLRELGAV
jgi:hypothetical protein